MTEEEYRQKLQRELNIFFIKVSPTSLSQTEAYLKNRQWKVQSSSGIREGLMWILRHLPQIIFVPADYPNRKMKLLPRLLEQTYPVKVVAYSESSNASATAMLNEMGCVHTLFPPTSGPSAERLLMRIAREWNPKDDEYFEKKHKNRTYFNTETGKPAAADVQISIEQVQAKFGQIFGQEIAKAKSTETSLGRVSAGAVKSSEALARKSLVQFSSQSESLILNAFKTASKSSCLEIESDKFKGLVVASFVKETQLNIQVGEEMKRKLIAFLRAHGETIKDPESTFKVVMTQVEPEPWALNHAEFLRKLINEASELTMVFFPTPRQQAESSSESSEVMVPMKIEDIPAGTESEYDLYIFMPENNKYLLYIPRGKILLNEQKARLQNRGLQNMHVRKDSILDWVKQKAQSFLNQKMKSISGGSS